MLQRCDQVLEQSEGWFVLCTTELQGFLESLSLLSLSLSHKPHLHSRKQVYILEPITYTFTVNSVGRIWSQGREDVRA